MMKSKMMASGGMMKSKMMASGGAMPMKDGKPAFVGDGKGMAAKGGMMKAKMMAGGGTMPKALAKHAAMKASKAHAGLKAGGMAYAKGGSASSRADGIAVKGKTKGKMV